MFSSGIDIHSFVLLAFWISIAAVVFFLFSGFHLITTANKVKFFRIRQDQTLRGWRSFLFVIFFAFLALFLRFMAEPIAYRYFPPTMTLTVTTTPSLSPTIPPRPSITLTPTITNTPSESYTPTSTGTPFLPQDVAYRFTSDVTPNPDTVLSELIFASQVDEDYRPLDPSNAFNNPLKEMYAIFSYDKMVSGAQFSALWYRDGQMVYFETYPWDGSTGGYAYSVWSPENKEVFQPGTYQVQMFVGQDWFSVGSFTIAGQPPTSTYTPIPTPTVVTKTPRPSNTPRPTRTPRPTQTRRPTRTPRPSATPSLTATEE